jgi:AcrR family transcriptional regulator
VAPVEEQSPAVAERPVDETSDRPRRRRSVPLVVRDDVVAAAMALLDEAGWEGLSMRAVCRRLGVSLPTVYAVVHSREAVVERAGMRGLELWVCQWQGDDGTHGGLAGDAVLRAAAAMTARPWLFDLVRLHPSTARAAVAGLPEATLQQMASLGPATGAPPGVGGRALDRALLVWMALEVAHRLMAEGLARGSGVAGARRPEAALVAALASGVLATVLGTVG